MKILILMLIAVVGNSWAQDFDKQVKDLQADVADHSSAQEQVIGLTRKNLALEIENRKLNERINELNQMVIEAAREKKDLEQELSEAERELAGLEKSNENLERNNQSLKATLDKVRNLVNPAAKN
ncbi:MAG: hypothetical protein NDI69_00490 [Bacteriovoracaceae bacterium]|nr:hypothetical protein [Bacteriovoracaceae bacterium]